MAHLRIIFIAAFILLLSGCRYAFQDESEVEEALLEITPLGISSQEARSIAGDKIGENHYLGHGPAEQTHAGWQPAGWYRSPSAKPKNGPYYFVFKLGSYPSRTVSLPTHVFARWYFDSNDRLVSVEVIKEIDGI